ncbi:MAG: 2-hydroxyacid dehydrogenase [Bacteroidota bacterium]
MKIAFFSTKSYDKETFQRYNNGRHQLDFFKAQLNINTVGMTEGYKAICVFVNDDVNAQVIKKLAKCKVKIIALRCAGFNNVDLEAAVKASIKVVRVPAYSPMAVAEHAVALIMTLNRKTHKAYNRVREGNFAADRLTGFNLHKKTVGVIGTGKIGVAFCKIMLGFGCRVLAFDVYENEDLKTQGVTYLPFKKVLQRSDIISLHCPLNDHTHHLMNTATFSEMKKGAMLINTSRGGLINTKAVIKALKKRKLGYLGIDVYEEEEELFFRDLSERIITDDQIMRLMAFPNVLVTAHQGFLTNEALENIANITLENISDFEKGKSLENEVTI